MAVEPLEEASWLVIKINCSDILDEPTNSIKVFPNNSSNKNVRYIINANVSMTAFDQFVTVFNIII
ncbi:MAG: hypothetical protein HOH72_00260 [Nitrosomonadales bacterium]|jgi:hypothetical protein|uniref:D-fructose-6-phosphate amidotransferase n=1 Tax=Methylophilales bacterium HTCC2181 TaxID=383631 RepID=A0P4Y7_9PROT|nr:D-fructose-6-phosphate amidotransferase [Methylophilales bacterium HTCC2181]MBT6140409.1 hypothetical protein [Nitrosomonadales bacterium]MBT6392194.1 hypothetical protein [Nitrosomonadales bacterium]MDC0877518.1 hypothetical protein [Methylophilaceae bacterium]